jgi:amino acid adenylation domain-containing protein
MLAAREFAGLTGPWRTKSPVGEVISGGETGFFSSKRKRMLRLNFVPIPEQISRIRESYPQSIALSYGDRQLNYEELDTRADQFAGHLAQLGIVSGSTVAICMERSFDWIVAALGTLRAGAAYVPLDSSWPDARLRFAVKDSGAMVLVARSALLDRLQCNVRGIDPCRNEAAIAASSELARSPIQPESLAYVVYTSGSTGTPKGVEITHANLSHLIGWHRDTFGVTQQDRASHLLGLAFDAAVLEIWAHLCAGATLCLADDEMRSSPELIQQWMVRERVTIGLVPAVVGARLMAMTWPATTALRLLVTGGDVLHQGPASQLPFAVVNNYGPTECTVVSTWAVLKPGANGAPPIGMPIAGASVYLLDEHGEPVPDGEVGEIYIGGSIVGRGYRNLPELTLRSFLPDPFAGAPSARMYRTGDRGVRRSDGEIEFRGRLDRQIKVRGQRVELDEIGSVLGRHPNIEFATAITRNSQEGENQLVAYVLPKENLRVPTVQELQKQLLRFLPEYMVPALFVRLHALPISPNGKLDHKMLPQPTDAQLLDGITAKVPATPIGEKVLTIVQDLLENDSVSAEDSFFLVGGHSLLGMQLVMRLRKTFGVNLTLRQLFEAPTAQGLASLIDVALKEKRLAVIWEDLLARKAVGLEENFFDLGGDLALIGALQNRITAEFGQRVAVDELVKNPTVRLQSELLLRNAKSKPTLPPGVLALQPDGNRSSIFWLHYLHADLGKVIGDEQPLLYVALTSEDLTTLGKTPSLEIIATCLMRKILTTQSKGPYTIGGHCLGGILAYEIASQLRDAGHEVSLVVLVDSPNPSYVESIRSVNVLVNYLGYVVQRAARLGLRKSLDYLSEHVWKYSTRILRVKSTATELEIIQRKIKVAALKYHPRRYDGKVLLLIASERPPHVNRMREWQVVVPRHLYAQYVDAHHRDLLKAENVETIAGAIVSQLSSATEDKLISCDVDVLGATDPLQSRNLGMA